MLSGSYGFASGGAGWIQVPLPAQHRSVHCRFRLPKRKLIVEADGGQHNPNADRARSAYLYERGFRVVRFWNHDILQNIDGVIETLLIILEGGKDPRG
jgi:very-short-patch-repair endonuclease